MRRPRNSAEHAAASQRRRKRRSTLTLFWNNAFLEDPESISHRLQVRPHVRHFKMVRLVLQDAAACRVVWFALQASPCVKTVHVLGCQFPNTLVAHEFFLCLSLCKNLREIHFSFSFVQNTELLGRGLQMILPVLSTTLRVVNVSGNPCRPALQQTQSLGQALSLALKDSKGRTAMKFDTLDLGMNHLGDQGIAPILRALCEPPQLPHGTCTQPGTRLVVLDLSDNDLTSDSLPGIIRVMRQYSRTLRTLKLSFNPQLFATNRRQLSLDWIHALRQCRKLRDLSVTDCGLDGGLATSIFASIDYFDDEEDTVLHLPQENKNKIKPAPTSSPDNSEQESSSSSSEPQAKKQKVDKKKTPQDDENSNQSNTKEPPGNFATLFVTTKPPTIPLKTLSIQRNRGIDQASWRYILCHRLPTLSSLRDLTVGGFTYEPSMLTALSKNISLECIHLESQVLGEAMYPILRRNRRLRQVESLMVDEVATNRAVLGQALCKVKEDGPVVGLCARFLVVSRLLVEKEEDSYRYRARKRRRIFERKRRKLFGDSTSNSSNSST